ncbi:60S ribosomal protein L7A [Gregarina niphandrodes]|uniref:60S ribosomal protein L7a n=1 Tax=Gregarina niphandrodes TaxID=110365 RepID=A0A023B103_GRENI|nr:60S ribosomal protein L7A [Gregarina niphandrodes]EZG46250.1 60S ribosomal protein L7A [Gregarina niphandrodes]|eukprot:XP_011132320.1 60S ribosomal protein L7A [Gregarina niphandrodes]
MAPTKAARHPLIEATPKKVSVNGRPRTKADLTRVVRWPKYIQVQRKRAILLTKLKVPPAINQFRHTANRSQATEALRLLSAYRPESAAQKKERLAKEAEARAAGEAPKSKKTERLVWGLDDVTKAIENKKAQLVVIPHDVDPVELVCWLPALCRKMNVPYCIIKGKQRLGALVHQKTCTAVALTDVRTEHKAQLETFCRVIAPEFIDNNDVRRRWGN